jgi:hypothetical protein
MQGGNHAKLISVTVVYTVTGSVGFNRILYRVFDSVKPQSYYCQKSTIILIVVLIRRAKIPIGYIDKSLINFSRYRIQAGYAIHHTPYTIQPIIIPIWCSWTPES